MSQQRNQNKSQFRREPKEFEEKVIQIKRLSKKTKGGNQISFSALVVIGNHKGKAGIGLDKAKDVMSAIQKAIRIAKKKLVNINIDSKGSIPHEIYIKDGASKILLKPAPEGTGVIAGGPVRSIVEAFGIKNIVSKRLGTSNKAANVIATFKALKQLEAPEIKPVTVNDKKVESEKSVSEKKVVTNKPEVKKTVKKQVKVNNTK